ncbi:hypothetical protein EV1_022967 [Malus domestica]
MASPSDSSSPPAPVPHFSSQNPNFSNSSNSYASLTIQNIGSMVLIKLKRSNYLLWRALFAPILRRYKLLGIIDGTELCPPPLLSDRSVNPAFEIWYEKYQNLLIWLNSTLSEDVIPFTVGVSSSRDLWLKLEHRFGGVSDAHIHQLRSRLQAIQKGSQFMFDYLQQVKEIFDSLSAAGAPISDRDLIAATLAGLPDEFESFIDSLMLRLSSTSLDELHGLLLTKELSMSRRKKLSSTTEPFHAFSVQSQAPLLPTPSTLAFAAQNHPSQPNSSRFYLNRGRNTNRGSQFNNNRFHSNRGSRGNSRGNSSHRGQYQGSRGSSFSSYSIGCQICGSTSHEALDCFDRMNPELSGRIPSAKLAAMCAHYSSKPLPSWLIDSGATSHITNDITTINSPTPYTGEDKVYIGDGKGLSIHHTGSSSLHTAHADFQLRNVLHVPSMKHNLLSAYQFVKDNHCALTLDSDGSMVKDRSTGKMLLQGPVKDGFYSLQSSSSNGLSPSSSSHALVSVQASLRLWHSRLGHPSSSIFRRLVTTNKLAIKGSSTVDFFCSDCAIAKNHKLPFGSSLSSSTHSLELLHCDLWGPAPVTSVSGFRYYLLIVDDFSKYSWLFPLKVKSQVYSTFVIFKNYVENLTGNKIKTVRSDSGGEFVSSSFKSYLHTHGILHQLSCPHTPEQNGCVERKHRHLVETARTLLVQSHVPHQYWVEAFTTALYLINRLPISKLSQSPWELLFHNVPDYSRLKVFGCLCFPWLKPYVPSKLDGKSTKCVFLGYSLQHKGYRCLDPQTQRVYISRHVIFDETTFPFSASSHSVLSDSSSSSPNFDLVFSQSLPTPTCHSTTPPICSASSSSLSIPPNIIPSPPLSTQQSSTPLLQPSNL